MPINDFDRTMKNTNIFYGVALLTLMGSFSILALFFYYLFVPVRVIELTEPVHVHGATVYKRGEPVTLELHYCKHKELQSEIQISFVNGDLIPALTTFRTLPTGCNAMELTAVVPVVAHADTYRMHLKISYKVNPLRREQYTFVSEPFEVIDDVKPEVVTPKEPLPEGGAK